MRQKSMSGKEPATQVVRNIRRAYTATFLGRRQDPHRAGRPTRRGQYRRTLPPRRDHPEPLLSLVEPVGNRCAINDFEAIRQQ